jgi:hypothetical protein
LFFCYLKKTKWLGRERSEVAVHGAGGNAVTKQNHVDQGDGGEQDAAVFGDGTALAKEEMHEDVQDSANEDGVPQHGQSTFHGRGRKRGQENLQKNICILQKISFGGEEGDGGSGRPYLLNALKSAVTGM